MHLLLVNPVVLSGLPALDLGFVEPECNLLLCGLDGVGAVAYVAADVLKRWCISVVEMWVAFVLQLTMA